MIKYIFILLTGFLASIVTGCDNTNLTHCISMVPRPVQMIPGSGSGRSKPDFRGYPFGIKSGDQRLGLRYNPMP